MPESGLRQRIRGALRTAFPGALVLGWPANSWTGGGWPDLLFLHWPLLIGLEVKQGRRSKPTPLQLARHALLREHHVPVFVIHTASEAIWVIAHIIERFPMAFDPILLAELDAALNEQPPTIDDQQDTRDAALLGADAPEPTLQEQADADQNAFDLANGTAVVELDAPVFEEIKLDADAPAPDIQNLIAATRANTEITALEVEALAEVEITQIGALAALKDSIDALTAAIDALRVDLGTDIGLDDTNLVPQTVEAPAPRRRRARSS